MAGLGRQPTVGATWTGKLPLQRVPEICQLLCATANPFQGVIADSLQAGAMSQEDFEAVVTHLNAEHQPSLFRHSRSLIGLGVDTDALWTGSGACRTEWWTRVSVAEWRAGGGHAGPYAHRKPIVIWCSVLVLLSERQGHQRRLLHQLRIGFRGEGRPGSWGQVILYFQNSQNLRPRSFAETVSFCTVTVRSIV